MKINVKKVPLTLYLEEDSTNEFRDYSERFGFAISKRIDILIKQDNEHWNVKKVYESRKAYENKSKSTKG